MPVCIAGMHRSGTSLLARLLNLAGLYLGEADELLAAGKGNSEGHWEHKLFMQLNEEILAARGGGWDFPPRPGDAMDDADHLQLERRCRDAVSSFDGREPWGWKDPRNSLTLPFWKRVLGPMPVVVSVRHPLEVSLSLQHRDGSTIAFGLALWTSYAEALLRETARSERIVTHYHRVLESPVAEMERIGARLGLSPGPSALERVASTARMDLRHSHFTADDLEQVKVSHQVSRLYLELCREADAAELGGHVAVDGATANRDQGSGRFDYGEMERIRRR